MEQYTPQHRSKYDTLVDRNKVNKIREILQDDSVGFDPVRSGYMTFTCVNKLSVNQVEILKANNIELSDHPMSGTVLRFKMSKSRFWVTNSLWVLSVLFAIISIVLSGVCMYEYLNN